MSHSAEQRPNVTVWPIQLRDQLPVIPVPLIAPDPDISLDLGQLVADVYERGAYDRQMDYHQPPPPPALSDEDAQWVETVLSAYR